MLCFSKRLSERMLRHPTSGLHCLHERVQGGLRLDILNGVAGTTVNITCGEALTGNASVGYTWGWEYWWTLRDGPQTLEQHKYFECR